MWGELSKQIGHFATTVFAYTLASIVTAFLLLTIRKLGWRWPVELGEFVASIFTAEKTNIHLVNVEYRDPTGALLDFGFFITASLRNGSGREHDLHHGCFMSCDGRQIKAGTPVVINIQDGLLKETLKVQYDAEKQVLFVCSPFTRNQLIERINSDPKFTMEVH
jgi:hypothetical protein